MHACIMDLYNIFCLQLLLVKLYMPPLVDVPLSQNLLLVVVLKTTRDMNAPAVLTVSDQIIFLAVKTLDAYVRTAHNNNYACIYIK